MDVSRVPQAEGARRAGGQGPGQEGQEKEGAGGEAGQGARQDGASSLLPPSFVFGSCFVSRTRSLFSCWFLFRFARPLVYFLFLSRLGAARAGPAAAFFCVVGCLPFSALFWFADCCSS